MVQFAMTFFFCGFIEVKFLICTSLSLFPLLSLDDVPHLSHMCRLQVRTVLGPDVLMRTGVVQQLPVPALLQDFLRFKDVPEPSASIGVEADTQRHRHVL